MTVPSESDMQIVKNSMNEYFQVAISEMIQARIELDEMPATKEWDDMRADVRAVLYRMFGLRMELNERFRQEGCE